MANTRNVTKGGAAAVPSAAPDPLRELERGVARVRAEIALYWLGFALEALAAGVLTYAVAWGVADVLCDLAPDTHRVVRALFFGLAAAGAAGLAVLAWRRIPDRGAIATRMEAREPAFEGSLLAAVQALEEPERVPAAVAWISAQRASEVLRVTGAAPIRPRVRRTPLHLWLFGTMIAILAAAGFFGPRFFQAFLRGFFPEDPAVFAPELALEVRPGNVEVAEGDNIAVEALLRGGAAAAVLLQVRDEDGEAGPAPEEHALARDASAGDTQSECWSGVLGLVARPRLYRVVAYVRDPGRVMPWTFASPWYRATPVRRARLLGLDVLVEPPEYSGGAPRLWKDPERVQVLARSTVTVLARAAPARDLNAGVLSAPGGLELPMNRLLGDGGEAAYRAGFVADRPGTLRLRVEPATGLEKDEGRDGLLEAALLLEIVQDLPPDAEAAIPEGAEAEALGLPVQLRLADDIGLVSARLVVKALPAGEGGDPAVAGKELSYKIPLDGSPKKVQARWYLPAQGLGDLLSRSFAYRVEATDGARPLAQTTQSPWQRWEPGSNDSSPQNGMLEQQGRRGRRQLARKDAFSKIPDLTPEQLAQLGAQGGLGGAGPGGGSGEERPKELVRPKAERLKGRDPADLGGDDSGGEAKGEQPKSGSENGKGEGTGEKSGEGKGGQGDREGKGNGTGEGERGSGEPGAGGAGGGGSGGGEGNNYERPEGLAQDAQGKRGNKGGGGGSSRGGSGQGGTGDGGAKEGPTPRDGGLKTGDERGRNSPEMTPPDLETLARMKNCSLDEAKAYAQRAGIEVANTGFGKEGGAERVLGVAESNNRRDGSFDLQTPQTLPAAKKLPEKAAPRPPQAPGAVRLEEIEPLYRPWVQGYFRQLRE
ncbi:MAG: DUF4175 domain-containing protein [Planctomycetes bacterium]|nr:DUF4175 domain-containing protein [Planctomycetota bacterium]